MTDNLVTYFELLRNSCRDLEIEIEKAEELGALFDSEEFWQAFVREVVKTNRTEDPGMVLSDPTTIGQSKQFQKGYNWEFMNHLREIARTSG